MLEGLLDKPLLIGPVALEGPLLLAPMAGITYSPFRLLAREQGSSLTSTGLISAHALMTKKERPQDLCFHPKERPLTFQLVGADPCLLAEAAAFLEERGADLIDVNMGCSVRKVLKSGGGAALLKDPSRAGEVLRRVVAAVRRPVTVKLRIGYDRRSVNVVELSRLAEACGVAAITIHGRTATQGFSGPVDWEAIARAKEAVQIPVIGNGDLRTPEEITGALRRTGCDGVMIGRAAMGRPWIFSHVVHYFRTGERLPEPSRPERYPFVLRHLRSLEELFEGQAALVRMRLQASWYSKGLSGSAAFRQKMTQTGDRDELWKEIESYFLGGADSHQGSGIRG